MLKISQRHSNNITFLDMEGILDIESEDLVKGSIADKSPEVNGNFVFNFNNVGAITSSGIGILLNAYTEISKKGGVAKLSNVKPTVLDAFQVHKVLPVFDIYPDDKAAEKRVRMELDEKDERIKRLFERINTDLKAKFKVFKKNAPSEIFGFKKAVAKSVSMCGIFLQTHDIYEANTILEVKLVLPGGFLKNTIIFLGKVVWIAEKESHATLYPGIALSILCIEEKERAKLEDFINLQGS